MKRNFTYLLIGTSVLLQGCLPDDSEEKNVIAQPDIASLYSLAGDYPIGVALPAGDATNSVINRDDLQQVVAQHFNQITAENIMKPEYLQPIEGTFYFDDADALIGYAEGINAEVHGHTLVWHAQIPQWMKGCANETQCSQVMNDHITAVASHFEGKVVSWDVVNEAFNEDGTYRDKGDNGSIWYEKIGENYIAQAFTTARSADANADLYYNDYNIEQNGEKLDAVITMVESLKSANVPIDGIGFQMHVGLDYPPIDTIKQALQKAQQTNLKVKITELDTRLNVNGNYTKFTEKLAAKQQQRYEDIVTTYLNVVPKAQRGGISVWGVSDVDSWIVGLYGKPDWPLLFDAQLAQKPAIKGFALGLESDSDDETFLFKDSFDTGMSWYEDDSSNVSGTVTHNAEKNTMDIKASLVNQGDTYVVATTFTDETTIDFMTDKTLSFDVYVPSNFGSDGKLAIQPFIMDGNYTPAFVGYQFGYLPGEWSTITIGGISPEFDFGYNGKPDFSQIDRIGLQFIANEADLPAGTIQIDNVIIFE